MLKEKILDGVRKIDLNFISFYSDSEDREIIKFAYRKKYITDSELESALEEAVFSRAKKDYQYLMNTTEHSIAPSPDYLPRPEFIAYGISKKIFSEKEIKKIPFARGETPEYYCKVYGKEDLLKNLKKEFLYPKPRKKMTSSEIEDLDLEHPVCNDD